MSTEINTICNCCFNENIFVIKCSINNNCDYSMCKNCIDNLKNKTKTNKCPACREEKIEIEIKSDSEAEPESDSYSDIELEISNNINTNRGFRKCIIDCIKILFSPCYIYIQCIYKCLYSYCYFTQILFSLVNIQNKYLLKFLTFFLSNLLIFTVFMLSRAIYILFFPYIPFWCNINCMILTTFPALFLFFLIIIAFLLIIKFIISCIPQ